MLYAANNNEIMETKTVNTDQGTAGRNTGNREGGNQRNAEREGFTAPMQEMAEAAKEYADLRIDEVKIDAVENMAKGFGRLLSAVMIIQLIVLVLTLLGLAAILLLGELIGSYALAAFIIAIVFAALAVVVFLTRKALFVRPFGKVLTGIFFKDAQNMDINAMRGRIRTERTFKEKELMLRGKYLRAFYSPANILHMLSGRISSAVFSIVSGIAEELFSKIKSRRAETAGADPETAADVTAEHTETAEATETSSTAEDGAAEQHEGAAGSGQNTETGISDGQADESTAEVSGTAAETKVTDNGAQPKEQ